MHPINVLVAIALLCFSCNESNQKGDNKNDRFQDSNNSYVLLDRKIYTENYIKTTIVVGMSPKKVESIIGEPYKTEKFMGTIRTSYLLSPPQSKGMHLIEFTVVYKNNEVLNVDMSWMGM